MKNSTLIRIKVPKALYESALRKALLEAGDKEPKGGHKGKKYSKETDYSKKAKVSKPSAKHKEVEPKGSHKGKKYSKETDYSKPVKEVKKKIKEEKHISDFLATKPNRDIPGDAQRLGERKRKMEEKKKMEERKRKVEEKKHIEERKHKVEEKKKMEEKKHIPERRRK